MTAQPTDRVATHSAATSATLVGLVQILVPVTLNGSLLLLMYQEI